MPEAIKKILILVANPGESSNLRADREKREIEEVLRRSQQRHLFSIEKAEAVRYNYIHRAMLDCNPNIVHFCGHGIGEAGLVFEDDAGEVQLVNGKNLAGLFECFASHIECVVLNACYSTIQAEAISQHIRYVIGTSQKIKDKVAIQFASHFYEALGAGKSYEIACKLACHLIGSAGIPENLIPQLLVNKNLSPQVFQSGACDRSELDRTETAKFGSITRIENLQNEGIVITEGTHNINFDNSRKIQIDTKGGNIDASAPGTFCLGDVSIKSADENKLNDDFEF